MRLTTNRFFFQNLVLAETLTALSLNRIAFRERSLGALLADWPRNSSYGERRQTPSEALSQVVATLMNDGSILAERKGYRLRVGFLSSLGYAGFRVGVDRVEPAFRLALKIAPPYEA